MTDRLGAAGEGGTPASPAAPDSPAVPASPAVPVAPGAGVLVIGYGNELCGDDAVGVLAASRMASDPRFRGATILAVRQLTPELADDMRGASLVVLVDAEVDFHSGTIAVRRLAGRRPGAPSAPSHAGDPADRPDLPGPVGARAAGASTSHHVDPGDLAALAHELWGAEPEVVVVSVGAVALELGDEPSPAVVAAVPKAVDEVAAIVEAHRRA